MRDVLRAVDPRVRAAWGALREITAAEVGLPLELSRATPQGDATAWVYRVRGGPAPVGACSVTVTVDGGATAEIVRDVPPQGIAVHVPSGLVILRAAGISAGDVIAGAITPGIPVPSRVTQRFSVAAGVPVSVPAPAFAVAARAQALSGACAYILGGAQLPAVAGPIDCDVSQGAIVLDSTGGAEVVVTWEVVS